MAVSLSSSRLALELPYICKACSRKLLGRKIFPPASQKRAISMKWIQKTENAKNAWEEQAVKIRAGEKQSMMATLEERGYINAVAGDRDELEQLMTRKRIGAYIGIDPTAPSLHVGHLLPLMALYWMFVHGFHAITLLGGATAQIGDPTGRTASRELPHSAVRKANMASMHIQLKTMWANVEHHARFKHGYVWEWAWRRELVNNNTWMNKLTALELLKVLGTGTRIGTMLGRDTVKNKMQSGDGVSFAEFTYPLLQAWDWWYMYNTKGIQLQIGGSDQFGNIIAGMDGINHIRKTHYDPTVRQEKEDPLMKPMGFTVPLLTTSAGEKFGKSAGNAVWLDKEMTSTFELYQFFLRTADADIARYLRLFTFVPISEIDRTMSLHEQDPSKRIAQRLLAREVVQMLHGAAEADSVESQMKLLFRPSSSTVKPPTHSPESNLNEASINGPPTDINVSLNPSATQFTAQFPSNKRITLPRSLIYEQPMSRILFSAGLAASRSEGHRLIINRGAYIGGLRGANSTMGDELTFTPIENWIVQDNAKYVMDDSLMILRVGKWKIRIVNIIPDEEFDAQGLDAPGWTEFKEGKSVFREEEKIKKDVKDLERAKSINRRLMGREGAVNKRVGTLTKEEEQMMEEFMQERYKVKGRGSGNEEKALDYTEWLRRLAEARERNSRAPE